MHRGREREREREKKRQKRKLKKGRAETPAILHCMDDTELIT